VVYSKKNFKEPLWRGNNVCVQVPKQYSTGYQVILSNNTSKYSLLNQ